MRPLLKILSLDPEILNNYGPVSDLSFLSKITHIQKNKIVLLQLSEHLENTNLFYPSLINPLIAQGTALKQLCLKSQGFLQLDGIYGQDDLRLRIIEGHRETLEGHVIDMLQNKG